MVNSAGGDGDTRGIVDPDAMLRLVDFDRHEAGSVLDGLVEWFWSVAWDLPGGVSHDQQVLNHPAGNISVGTIDESGVALDPPQGRVYGVFTAVSSRHLSGRGWTVAARTTVGGLGVFLDGPAKAATDTQLSFSAGLPGLGPDADRVVTDITAPEENQNRVNRLRTVLEAVVEQRPQPLIDEARSVAEVAAKAEQDRTICRVEQLASSAGVSVRSLQRLFDTHVGVSPSFVIRRWRIIEAAEAAKDAMKDAARGSRDGTTTWPGWSTVAAELGYADQAHLARDFRRHLGVPPSAYVARNSAGA